MNFAINGFGRIGKSVLKAYAESGIKEIKCVAINLGVGSLNEHLHLLKYDSVHGNFSSVKQTDDSSIDVGFGPIKVISEPDPAKINWNDLGVELVMECSGRFASKELASIHLKSGAKKVIVSAPADGADATIVYGVNNNAYDPIKHSVISAGSCTTNCLAPLAKKLNDLIGIDNGFMTTIHAYTNDQNLIDSPHKDLRRARAAALSMIPSSTGAAKAIGLVIPELSGKLDGVAIRVPTPNVSLVDLKFNANRETSVKEINDIMKAASIEIIGGVLAYNEEELVSIDFNHNKASSIFDATQTKVVNGRLCRVAAWYDNEWGFSNRMIDVAKLVSEQK
jgi:glyceraldehyde 3-phosphate dehydrogenase